MVRRGVASHGPPRPYRARPLSAWARRGEQRRGDPWSGMVINGEIGRGAEWHGMERAERPVWLGEARFGPVWTGRLRTGPAWLGVECW